MDRSEGKQGPEVSNAPNYPALDATRRDRVAGLLLELIEARLPITDAQRSELSKVIGVQLAQTEALHAFKLANSDEPGFVMPAGGMLR